LHLHLPSLHRNPPATDEAPPTTGGRLGGILRRRRSNGGDVSPQETPAPTTPSAALRSPSARPTPPSRGQALPTRSDFSSNTPREPTPAGPTHRLRLVPHLDPSARTLHFEPIIRDVRSGGTVLRIGRFTDKVGMAARQPESNKIAFRSKVVSRAHAEIWCAPNGKFMIRDTRSSSGTFLNHTRLSAPNIESRPNELHDGDIVQLGVDYQGGNEEIYRCVKMRVEVGREWQLEANEFNTGALKQLQTLQGGQSSKDKGKARVSGASAIAGPSNSRKTSVADCCICLFPVAILQSLFIAPCSHCFHYKCIRPLLVKHHPGFSCPLCRTFADLEEDVEKDQAPSLYAPSVREPSVYAASVYEVEAACNLIETAAATAITGRQCVDVCVGTSPAHSPSLHAKALPPVPTGRQSTGDTEGSDRIRPGSTHSGPPHHSDGGSTPRGSSEDLRAAQRNMFDTTLVAEEPEDGLVRVPGGIIIPRTPDREQDMFNSATPLNNQFLTLAVLNGIGSGLPSIPSAGDIQALRRTSEDESSVDLATPYRTGDTESAKFILVDAEDVEDDDEALVIAGVKRMSTTEEALSPSSQI
ncbi:hypothetical protein RSAG8_13424, partial [Rhizoctonia solani AG-8 WAC10335]